MNSKVTYLASRSLAVYETSLILQFEEMEKRNARIQKIRLAAIWSGFLLLAALACYAPVLAHKLLVDFAF